MRWPSCDAPVIYDDLVRERGIDPVWDAELVRCSRAVIAEQAGRWNVNSVLLLRDWALVMPIIHRPLDFVVLSNLT